MELNGLKGIVQEDHANQADQDRADAPSNGSSRRQGDGGAASSPGAGAKAGAVAPPERCKVRIGDQYTNKVIAVKVENLTLLRAADVAGGTKPYGLPRSVLDTMVAWSEKIMLGATPAASERNHKLARESGRLLPTTMTSFLVTVGKGILDAAGLGFARVGSGREGLLMTDSQFSAFYAKHSFTQQHPELISLPFFYMSPGAEEAARLVKAQRPALGNRLHTLGGTGGGSTPIVTSPPP